MLRTCVALSFLFLSTVLFSQDEEYQYVEENPFVNDNRIYEDGIHTVQLTKGGSTSILPFVRLGGNERLTLRFDDFSLRQDDINYRIVHCESDWETSDVPFHYYAQGVEEGFIYDYDYSRTMNQKFVHYKLEIPNDEIVLTASGNYLLHVYRNGNPNQSILTHRFYVTEDKLELKVDIHPAFDPMYRNTKQEIDFSVISEKMHLVNPDENLKMVLLQNMRWDNAITDLKPLFIQGNELLYTYDGENTFWAGNEYRYFDIRNWAVHGENVDGYIKRIDTMHIFMEKVTKKKSHNAMDAVQNRYGGYFLGAQGAGVIENAHLDADYAKVYFYILSDDDNPNGDYYAFGGLSNFVHDERFKFKYNEEKKRYELRVFLKQGVYNWHHHFVRDKGGEGQLKQLEGNYAITNNQYTLLAYYKAIGDDFDRLLKVSIYTFPLGGDDGNE